MTHSIHGSPPSGSTQPPVRATSTTPGALPPPRVPDDSVPSSSGQCHDEPARRALTSPAPTKVIATDRSPAEKASAPEWMRSRCPAGGATSASSAVVGGAIGKSGAASATPGVPLAGPPGTSTRTPATVAPCAVRASRVR